MLGNNLFTQRFGGGESMMQLAQRIYTLLDELKTQDKTCLLYTSRCV